MHVIEDALLTGEVALNGLETLSPRSISSLRMSYPMRTCLICSEEFELKPDKPGFANRCPDCTEKESDSVTVPHSGKDALKGDPQANAARRQAMRELLYNKDN
jgi:DNA-directed RNA polymerase subunit RPC12/RpoP